MSKKRFSDFITDEPTLADALAKCRQFVADIQAHPFRDGYCLSLCGKSGTGKTMLTEIILDELGINRWNICSTIKSVMIGDRLTSFDAEFFYMPKVSDGFKAGRYSVVEAMEETWLSVLDDIGADHDPSKVTASKVDRVLRSRRGRWTLATFNLPLNEIAQKIDARVASWIIRDDNRFVEIKAQDFALRKANRK